MRNRLVVSCTSAIAGAVVVFLVVGVSGFGVAATDPTTPPTSGPPVAATAPRTITVTGQGEVSGVPDVAQLSIGVSSRAKSAADALSTMSDHANTLIGVIENSGVAEKDVQTTGLSLQPTTDNSGQITGYEASTSVVAQLRDISKVGATIDAASTQVGDDTRLDGVTFSITDTSSLMSTARADAVRQARTKANDLAKAAGVQLGDVQSISDASAPTPLPLAARAPARPRAPCPCNPEPSR